MGVLKLKKYYRFESDFSLHKLLWEEIQKRGLVVEGYVGLCDYHATNVKYYYLTSHIGYEPVKLQSSTEGVDILHGISFYEDLEWIDKQGLQFFRNIRT